jgi:hypothetical protein
MKIGQYPAPTVYVPKGLEANLGKDATALYRKALMVRNMGYGLAAVGYMRRVVEDKTNELIEVAGRVCGSEQRRFHNRRPDKSCPRSEQIHTLREEARDCGLCVSRRPQSGGHQSTSGAFPTSQ